jgi:hypothetical protein
MPTAFESARRIATGGVIVVGGSLVMFAAVPSVDAVVAARQLPPAFVQAAAGEEVVAQAPIRSTGKYRASGDALLVRRTDGSLLVRLQNLDMDDGPALRLHLVRGRDQKSPEGGADLGPLKATRGTHDYAVPAGAPVDLQGGTTVLVYCHKFHVPFANATLASS